MNSTKTNSANQFDSYSIVAALLERIYELMEHLGLEFEVEGNRFFGCCPIHKGNNQRAFSMFLNSGSWRCYTHNCHETMKPTLINLLSTVLGKSTRETFDWAVQFLDGKVKQVEQVDISLRKVEKIYSQALIETNKKIDEIEKARARLDIPSKYFISRGYSPDILKEFDVGMAKSKLEYTNPFFERIIAPVKDDCANLVGYTARSIHKECPDCGGHHDEKLISCPKIVYPKWRHWGFNSGHVLYGLDTAKDEISKTKKVFIVEGCPDLWKARMMGIKNSVAIFGNSLKDGQIFLLEKLGIYDIFGGQDNDGPGEEGFELTKLKCCHLFNVNRIRPQNHDWENSDFTEVKEKLCKQ